MQSKESNDFIKLTMRAAEDPKPEAIGIVDFIDTFIPACLLKSCPIIKQHKSIGVSNTFSMGSKPDKKLSYLSCVLR